MYQVTMTSVCSKLLLSILNNEITPVLIKINNDKEILFSQLNSDDSELKTEIESEYDILIKKLKSYNNIRRIQGVKQDSLVLKNKFTNLISTVETQKSVIIDLNYIIDEEIEILNEEDIENFLEEIRKNVMNELKNKTIVKLRL